MRITKDRSMNSLLLPNQTQKSDNVALCKQAGFWPAKRVCVCSAFDSYTRLSTRCSFHKQNDIGVGLSLGESNRFFVHAVVYSATIELCTKANKLNAIYGENIQSVISRMHTTGAHSYIFSFLLFPGENQLKWKTQFIQCNRTLLQPKKNNIEPLFQ